MKRFYLLTVFIISFSSSPLWAQVTVDLAPERSTWSGTIIELLLILGVLLASFMPSKRSHLD